MKPIAHPNRPYIPVSLQCVECGYEVTNKYAIDRMLEMTRHWKRAGHAMVPVFDCKTWESCVVVPLGSTR